MSDFNKVIITGHLTRDIELHDTKSGKVLGSSAIAINTGYGDNKSTCFLDITLWGKTAENCEKFIGKGSKVLVEGRLEQDNWDDNDGKKRSKIKCSVFSVTFLDNRDDVKDDREAQF